MAIHPNAPDDGVNKQINSRNCDGRTSVDDEGRCSPQFDVIEEQDYALTRVQTLDTALERIYAFCEHFNENESGLEQVGGAPPPAPNGGGEVDPSSGGVVRREKPHPPRTDPHRLSRANLEESGDLELDAILSELCALETKFNFEISGGKKDSLRSNSNASSTSNSTATLTSASVTSSASPVSVSPSHAIHDTTDNMPAGAIINSVSINSLQSANGTKLSSCLSTSSSGGFARPKTHSRNGSGGGNFKGKYEADSNDLPPTTIVSRTDSPDNDSAFSDSVSMLSSESSASSGASGGGGVTKKDNNKQMAPMDHAAKVKAEKIKMALEKLKEANVKKLYMKAFSQDGSSKSLLVDEKMTVAVVCRMLTDKNHVRVDPKWAIVEHLPDLYMERVYEDDEMLVDNLLMWARDSKNKLLFVERPDKFDLFFHPENYLLYGNSHQSHSDIDDEGRNNMLEEFFSSSRVPEVEGPLYLKSEGKKAWKKFFFVLRQSGLYYSPKGKSCRSSKDLVCLATLDNNQVYHGFGWRKKFKSPSDWCFAIKLSHLQAKSAKHIKYLCAEDEKSLRQWVMGIRVAKSGVRLQENFRSLVEEIAQEDIDRLASCRSFSLASVTHSSSRDAAEDASTPSSESRSLDSCLAPSLREEDVDDGSEDTPVNTLARPPAWRREAPLTRLASSSSSSSSSGCLSERSSSSGATEGGFEADFPPQGTIKRKPSNNPKLPLTSTTRHLVKEVDLEEEIVPQRTRRSLSEEVSTLRRRASSRADSVSVASSLAATTMSEESRDSLPLPPPPLQDPSACDPDMLPPPPPELLSSTLSLDSLLPPPPEETALYIGVSDMTCSITSLPPPPPPLCLTRLPSPTRVLPSPPATPPKPKGLLVSRPLSPSSKLRRDSFDNAFPHTNGWPTPPPSTELISQTQKSSQKRVKKISFVDHVETFPPSPPPSCVAIAVTGPSSPSLKPPPQPPRRSQSTRLSPYTPPGRLNAPGCKVTPPKSFLTNLQRVMQKKWQVAQKCRDLSQTPHEVLGFRDPLPPVETERNVGQWISQHYGTADESPALYENVQSQMPLDSQPVNGMMSPTSNVSSGSLHHPQQNRTSSLEGSRLSNSSIASSAAAKRKPPPPPPKRANTTQLSIRH